MALLAEKKRNVITRRWVLNTHGAIPIEVLDQGKLSTIEYAYLSALKDKSDRRVYATGENGEYHLHVFHGREAIQEVWKQEMPQEAWRVYWDAAKGSRFRKDSASIQHLGHKLTISAYLSLSLADFNPVIIQCDFESLGKSAGFILPDWAQSAVDISDNPYFDEMNLAAEPQVARESL